ncbi:MULTISPECIES: F0F1 ATP synthase subunit delta [Rhodobacterales]|uniref:F0F1 ATP synthase subunit delta n=1 Tax=Roseobacter sp. N2S TaxID=2663844 RepID=UPI0028584F92|nr:MULTISPECIES: F0F1 ATP synthase subunit delta [Rhodobacterales]MDR6266108.1 F-type H+-transporting ATPase subunit delta [Roseobacter sp. N2S]
MSDKGSISSGIAVRYATAVFELAKEAKKLPALETDLDALTAALEDSTDFVELISNPVYTRDEMAAAVAAIGKKMKLTPIVVNTLGLMAQKRRLFVLPALVTAVKGMIADEKGEVSAEVTAAKKLTKAQEDKLTKTLKASIGKEVIVNVTVDEGLIGGLIVKVGSKLIDTSIKSKLSNLQNAMKEVG